MGARLPESTGPDARFLYGCPPWIDLAAPPTGAPEAVQPAVAWGRSP